MWARASSLVRRPRRLATRCCRTSEDARATLSVIMTGRGNQPRGKRFDSIRSVKVEPLLLEVADVVNTTLDLDTTLRRVAELVRKVIDYEIFAILLVNEKAQTCESVSRWDMRAKLRAGKSRLARRNRQAQSVARPSWSMTCRSIRIHLGGRPTCARNWRFHLS